MNTSFLDNNRDDDNQQTNTPDAVNDFISRKRRQPQQNIIDERDINEQQQIVEQQDHHHHSHQSRILQTMLMLTIFELFLVHILTIGQRSFPAIVIRCCQRWIMNNLKKPI